MRLMIRKEKKAGMEDDIVKISFCEKNKGKRKVINKLEENYPHIEIKVENCLGRCGVCSEASIAKVHNKLIVEKSTEELYKKLVKIIEEK